MIDPQDFVNDAVGGAGFTNAGEAQFIEDAALERYLEAAKKVAAHTVIGAGPLTFDIDPGMTEENFQRFAGFRGFIARMASARPPAKGASRSASSCIPKRFISPGDFSIGTP